MKELSIEEKAKRYDNILERAKDYQKVNDPAGSAVISEIFPELVENEDKDEKMRKNCIHFLELQKSHHAATFEIEECIDWLEKHKEPEDKGEISDGYHTFNELYRYRMLYNAAFFNLLPKEIVHKSKRHHDGEECFGGGWFIVMANLPTGQISNHYELKDWDLFQIPEKEIADEWDGHTPQEAAERLHKYLLEKQGEQVSTAIVEQDKQYLYDIITVLWDLLDKIDTFADLQIDNTNPKNPFRKIEDITQERHKLVKSDGYNLFIKDLNITNRKFLENENSHEYVDLGLSSGTKWATCNVGATKPEEYGDYFAWGETTTKEKYDWNTYKYGIYEYDGDYSKLTKYNLIDCKTTLDPSDDAAHANWGGKWHMPTSEQQDEIRNECYWVWTENYNGSNVKGYIVYKAKNSDDKGKKISKKNGTPSSSYSLSDAHIFLPAAGHRNGNITHDVGYTIKYWSSSLHINFIYGAWVIYANASNVYRNYDSHCIGLTIRPVLNQEK